MLDNGEHRGQHGRTEVCGDVQGVEVADFMHIFREVIKEAGFAYHLDQKSTAGCSWEARVRQRVWSLRDSRHDSVCTKMCRKSKT